MREIFLDGVSVVTTMADIKINVESPFFTRTSSYTYEVEIPLNVPVNKRLFGNIDRIDSTKDYRTFSAKISIDGNAILDGEAHITQVSKDSVRVQILGDAAAYNYRNKDEKIYIDELSEIDGRYGIWDGLIYQNYAENKIFGVHQQIYSWDSALYKDTVDGDIREFVLYPTINASSGDVVNALTFHWVKEENYLAISSGVSYEPGGFLDILRIGDTKVAIQPFIWYLCELIARATGFNLRREDNEIRNNPFFRRIFMVNTHCTKKLLPALPHWTVNEFWGQIENLFGVVIATDYNKKEMAILSRASYFKTTGKVMLDNIVDEFEVTFDDEEQSDISSSNVGYADFIAAKEDVLSDEIMEMSVVSKEYSNIHELLEWERMASDADIALKKNVIFELSDGRQFILANNVDGEPGLLEVNMLRNRVVNKDSDSGIELKFIPARFSEASAYVFNIHKEATGETVTMDHSLGLINYRVIEVDGPSDINKVALPVLDIEAAISSDGDDAIEDATKENIDNIFIAIANGYQPDVVEFTDHADPNILLYIPLPFIRERTSVKCSGETKVDMPGCSLSLVKITGQDNLGNATTLNATIRTDVKHRVSFIRESIPPIDSVFIIRNKLFVAEKFEATATADGLGKIITGYFYEFES